MFWICSYSSSDKRMLITFVRRLRRGIGHSRGINVLLVLIGTTVRSETFGQATAQRVTFGLLRKGRHTSSTNTEQLNARDEAPLLRRAHKASHWQGDA